MNGHENTCKKLVELGVDVNVDTPGGTAVLRAVPSQHSRLGINRLLRCVAVLNKSRSHAQCNTVYGGPIVQLVIY